MDLPTTLIPDLGSSLERAYRSRNDHEFLPHDQLDKFVTRKTVDDVLKVARVDDAENLAQFVLRHAKRLFLILVLMSEDKERLSLLADLKRSKITDASLPIKFDRVNQNYYWFSLEVNPIRKDKLFGEWSRMDRDLLDTYQWRFLAPVFGDGPFRFHFHPRRILPYIQADTKASSSGFFGEVSRTLIHRAHVPLLSTNTDTETIAIAIKKAKHGEELAEFFDKEASNLHKLQQYKSPHLIKPIAAYQQDQDRCLIFPWADGGNLLNYWKRYRNQRSSDDSPHWFLSHDSLRWLLGQLEGVCSAVQELHEENTRHGDLKPENILWFKDGKDCGILQIADLGLAAFHEKEADTQNRKGVGTQTPSGTSRYEPPEMDEKRNTDDPRSRQYDIWSMGCVLLELLLWLVYGYDSVEAFQGRITHFWECHDNSEGKEYTVHPYVVSCMREMMSSLPSKSAYKDLLYIVQQKLLVVVVSQTYESFPDCRETAEALHAEIARIVENSAHSSPYLTLGKMEYPADKIRRNVGRQGGGGLAAPRREEVPRSTPALGIQRAPSMDGDDIPRVIIHTPTGEFSPSSLITNVTINTKHQEHSNTLNDNWHSAPDNDFAVLFFNAVGWEEVKPEQPVAVSSLCTSCSTIDSTPDFNGECNVSDLERRSHSCDLCSLLFRALDGANIKPPRVITLEQQEGTVGIKDGPRLLSIYVEPSSNTPEGTQLGLPNLLQPTSRIQFALLQYWIAECDSNHDGCRRKKEDVSSMPTRLVEVDDQVRLVDSARISPSPYIALSHCWGQMEDNTKFCTFKHNIDQLKTSINVDRLPPLFRDAVAIVRGLGLRYIWIDSLCIVQDDDQDWETEAGKMEQVFSGAYFTIAASSAKSSNEGFLSPRSPRPCVQISTQDVGQVYVCVNIDNFHKDVELGELNRRGWVLQERVLSRRSIYFSSTQMYWECGAGVHCETLTRLHNSKAAFLGDANFPESALEYYRDGRQVLVQDLYERYSGLAFTKPSDRSVAILGLQKRLARAFQTQAAFGLLAVYFGRGLLWQRRDVRMMKRISCTGGRSVPSWSWFSKEGPIKYMNIEFEKVDWATKEFRSLFQRRTAVNSKKPSDGRDDTDATALRAPAGKLQLTKLEMLVRIVFDSDEEFDIDGLRCVVVGRDKSDSTDDPKQHALVVYPLDGPEKETYERVGVASLKPAHVGDEKSWITIR